ncbi:MAG: hypothetical protein FJ206_05350 [Gemmatimonadetes bacterium]|nr:hypothetical protein [Gemmatimonadota bacterium]
MRALWLGVGLSMAAAPMMGQDADRSVKGGIAVDGWKGRVDRAAIARGKTIADSRFGQEGSALRLSVGPAGIFWNPSHQAKGDYLVKATFKEHKMRSSHPHSYGIFIGGADLESETETLMYCIVYGNGTYSVKTFHGANVVTLVDRAAHPALQPANAEGEATNEIGWRVQGGKAACVVNGTEVKSFDRAEVVAADKLKSLDGGYGIRVSHNLELTVTGLSAGKP